MRERKNVYKLPASDKTLEWYGKAVIAMKNKPTTDPRSWNYQAAIHGIDPGSPFWKGAAPFPGRRAGFLEWLSAPVMVLFTMAQNVPCFF